MSELDRRYYDLETHILATTPRCASNSIKSLHQDLPLRTAEWVHKNRDGRLCYGVMRNPFDRMMSAWKLLAPKHKMDLSISQMLKELADNPHVMQNADLHRGVVDVWLDFAEFTAILPVHLRKSADIMVPEFHEDLVLQFYRDDWEIWSDIQIRPAVSSELALGLGTGSTAQRRDPLEGFDPGEGDDGRSDGVAQRREFPGPSWEAEDPGSEGAGLGDDPIGDLLREWSLRTGHAYLTGGGSGSDAEPPGEDGEAWPSDHPLIKKPPLM